MWEEGVRIYDILGVHNNFSKNTVRNHFQLIFSLESFSLTNLSIRGDLADATLACYSSPQFILQDSHLQRRSHSQHRPSVTMRSSTVDFLHHQFGAVCGNSNHSSDLSQWQKGSSKYKMEAEAIPQPDAMQQQQIQALLANVKELTLGVYSISRQVDQILLLAWMFVLDIKLLRKNLTWLRWSES